MATKNFLDGIKLRRGETQKLTFLGGSCLDKGREYEWEYGQDRVNNMIQCTRCSKQKSTGTDSANEVGMRDEIGKDHMPDCKGV